MLQSKFLPLCLFGLIFTCTFNFSQAAYALPGQDITTVVKWSEKHPILSKLNYSGTRVQKYQPDYYTQVSLKGEMSTLLFNVWLDKNKNVTSEVVIYINKNPLMKCGRKDMNFLNFIQQMYNQAVVDDFHNSKYVASVGSEDKFYQGEEYGYYISDSPQYGNFVFKIMFLKDLENEIKLIRYCKSHGCNPY